MTCILKAKSNTGSGGRELNERDPIDAHQKVLATILKFSALINSSLNIEDVLNCAMKWAEEFMNVEASTIYELDEEKGILFIRNARGEKKEHVKKIKIKLGEGIAGHVVKTGQPMVIQDVRKEKRFSNKFDRITGFKTRSMICVPLILRNKPIGAFQVINKKSGQPFLHSDLEFITSMSQQIAVALENAKLYQLLERNFELTTRELKKAQEKLIRSERLVAMGHLIQGIAHEIRNPITTIGGFARRIKKAFKKDPKLQEYINIILEESERLEGLVKRVREFINFLTSTFEIDDIKEIIDQVLERFKTLALKLGVSISSEVDQGIPFSRMDSPQIAAALSNIVENALESMPDGGKLTLGAKHEGDHILITITDTGCGIAKENMDSIYDPFYTSKIRGIGFGLTMVHQILMNHDGEINIQSQEGKGTTVTLRLPIMQ
jgi:signal transduction histidine kinase